MLFVFLAFTSYTEFLGGVVENQRDPLAIIEHGGRKLDGLVKRNLESIVQEIFCVTK